VQNELARKRLMEAEEAVRTGDYKQAMEHATAVFRRCFEGQGPMSNVGWDFTSSLRRAVDRGPREVGAVIQPFIETLKQMDRIFRTAIDLMSVRIDLRNYQFFKSVTPQIVVTAGGQEHINWRRSETMTKENAEKCIAFVIDCMLRLETLAQPDKFFLL
jgi:hypothetical protein